jgi:Uma2 family endonuclease
MSTIASQLLDVPVESSSGNGAPHPVSSMIDATETLYRFTAEEYEQIAEILDDDRVELIDGYLVKKMTKLPPHVLACARVLAAITRLMPAGWHARPGEPVRLGQRSEPEPDVSLARGAPDDYSGAHPGPSDIGLLVEVADTTLPKDRRRTQTYGPAGIPVYWIVNLVDRQIEVYSDPRPDGYATLAIYRSGQHVPVVLDGTIVGQVAVDDILP